MIKINLATRKQAAFVNPDKAPGSAMGGMGAFSKLKNLSLDDIRVLPIRSMALLLAFAIAGQYFVGDYKKSEIKKLEDGLEKLNQRKLELTSLSRKSQGFQEIKKSLESDEFTMRTKIDTIQKLMLDRKGSSELLIVLADVIPEDVWLSQVGVKDAQIQLKGNSTNFDLVSDFMKKMGESPSFADLVLKSTQKNSDPSGVEVATFELSARRRP